MFDRFHDWYDKQKEPYSSILLLLLAVPIITAGLWVKGGATALLFVGYTGAVLIPRITHNKRKKGRWLP